MPKITIAKLTVESEALGFSPTETPSEEHVVARIAGLTEQLAIWQKKAKEAMQLNERNKQHQERLRELECDLLLKDAVRDFKISEGEVKFYKQMYQKDPMLVKGLLEAKTAQEFLKREQGLSGDEPATTASAIAAARVAEIMANNNGITEAQAYKRVWDADNKLWKDWQREKDARTGSLNGGGV